MNENKTLPLYSRITDFHGDRWCCGDARAVCPDCGDALCVFCEDECPGCQASIF